MNTTSLKSFAPAVRLQLMEAVTRKLDYVLSANTPDLRQLADQVTALRREAAKDRKGLVERVAYTWFNRLAALRFLDARGWHPFRARVLTAATAEETQPELLKLMRSGSLPQELHTHTGVQRLNDLLDQRLPTAIAGADPQGEVYRHLVLAVCHLYHALMPDLFERVNDETELLLPDDLLTATSVVEGFRTEITDEDCTEVEVLGWLYQFYISEKKDAVMARKSAVPTEDIPAVTQLFTPHWIVRYLVENSLGRLWLQNRPGSRLREHMAYYIEDAAPEPLPFQAEWKGHIPTQSEGDFQTFLWLRPNADLKSDEGSVIHYALTIDGYAYAQQVWGIETPSSGGAADKLASMIQDGRVTGSFADLRAALYLWQRATKWGEDVESFRYFDLCYEALCAAWDKEWRKNERLLPDLAAHGIRLPEAPAIDLLKISRPEEIRLVDPAVGSGHMLTYAFDLLYRIYEEEGHAPSEIPALILRHNLHGLEICPRATQLAQLALIFKARDKSRRFFQPEHIVRPNIVELKEIRFEEHELRDYIQAFSLGDLFNQPLLKLLHQFEETKNFGSLIQPCLDERSIAEVRKAIEGRDLGGQLFLRGTHQKILCVLEQAEALCQRHHVVVANPPYLGRNQMNDALKKFGDNYFCDTKYDLFTMFIERCSSFTSKGGITALMTPFTWMFLSSYESFRKRLINDARIHSLVKPQYHTFFSSAAVPICAFVFEPNRSDNSLGNYFDLSDFRGAELQPVKLLEAVRSPHCNWKYIVDSREFNKVPGAPISFWLNSRMREAFTVGTELKELAPPKQGLKTGDNDKFLRFWVEVSLDKLGFNVPTPAAAADSNYKWFPCAKGGNFRKWWGNNEFVINWESEGKEIRNFVDEKGKLRSRPQNTQHFFKGGITWSTLTISHLSMRVLPIGFVFESKGSTCIVIDRAGMPTILAFLNSSVVNQIIKAISPTIDYGEGAIGKLPFVAPKGDAASYAKQATYIARTDWDNFETSWDFRDLPLLRSELKDRTLEATWRKWEAQCAGAIRRMQELETENNRLFIAAYGLEGELQPEVPEEQITLARADVRRDVAAFLSYAIGCMMGRYSLDQPGLILAKAGDTLREFLEKVGKPLAELSFAPDEDGIVPMLDGEWFEDDIVARTREFLRATFGEATLNDNLRFIEQSLGKPLDKYFLTDFYKDHLQTYKKRPIYWLFQSPKKGFSALVYLHRYTKDTCNTLLNKYLRDYLHKLENRISHLTEVEAAATKATEKSAARKEADKLKKALKDCQDWERDTLLPLAQKRLEIDLDDGVKVNYLKFGDALAPIAGLASKEDE